MPEPRIDKIPQCCPSKDAFQEGDILIFNTNPENAIPASTQRTVDFQYYMNNAGGHKESVHVAFVVKFNNKKYIAHLRSGGLILDECESFSLKTVTHIYRPKVYQQELAKQLQVFIETHQEHLRGCNLFLMPTPQGGHSLGDYRKSDRNNLHLYKEENTERVFYYRLEDGDKRWYLEDAQGKSLLPRNARFTAQEKAVRYCNETVTEAVFDIAAKRGHARVFRDGIEKQIHWTNSAAVYAAVCRLFFAVGIQNENPALDPDPAQNRQLKSIRRPSLSGLSSSSVCSIFLAEAYAGACDALSEDNGALDMRGQLMNINTATVLKTLQAYLYRCSNYDYFVMPHENYRGGITDELIRLTREQIKRLEEPNRNELSKTKACRLTYVLQNFLLAEEARAAQSFSVQPNQTIMDDFEKAKRLLKKLVLPLQVNTGTGFKRGNTTSYLAIKNFAKSQGLYESYYQEDLRFAETKEGDLTECAKNTYYRSQPKLAAHYAGYRRKGYSDAEARFECEPAFFKWIALNPRRWGAALLFGLLLAEIPAIVGCAYGLWRVHDVKSRVKKLGNESAKQLSSFSSVVRSTGSVSAPYKYVKISSVLLSIVFSAYSCE